MKTKINSDDFIDFIEKLRPEVVIYALMMESKLQKNDHKGGWFNRSNGSLWHALHNEIREFDEALINRATADVLPIFRESADMSNYGMMIADNLGALDEYYRLLLKKDK